MIDSDSVQVRYAQDDPTLYMWSESLCDKKQNLLAPKFISKALNKDALHCKFVSLKIFSLEINCEGFNLYSSIDKTK